MADDEVSLRPVVLKPGGNLGGNPFASFGKGLGFGIKAKQAPINDDRFEKKEGPRVRYSKEFLLQFMQNNTKSPVELQNQNYEFVISEEEEKDQQRKELQKVAEELDERDWRVRNPATAPSNNRMNDREYRDTRDVRSGGGSDGPAANGSAPPQRDSARESAPARDQQTKPAAAQQQPPQQQAQQQSKEAPRPAEQPAAAAASAQQRPNGQELSKMQKAEDKGRQAYKVGAAISGEERAIRQVKGILNKLTPEKFERLLQQLLEVITTADILQKTIALVFENAVEQPTYCAMYADLCMSLSKELPLFPPPIGSDRPLAFRQILLNTCQDEFEGAEAAREALANVTEPDEREAGERSLKKRVMGTMRLIGELYKKDMVRDWIMTTCIDELLNARASKSAKVPPEDSIESACEILTTAGAKLSKSEKAETLKKLDKVFKELARLEADKSLPLAPRIRFVVRDVLELRRNNWVPRREVFTAKKLDEVRAQAEAELGLVSSSIAASLPTLPTQQRLAAQEEFVLIPPLRGDAADAWSFPAFRGDSGAGGAGGKALPGGSALLGDYKPPERSVLKPAAPQPAQAQQPAQPARPNAPAPPASKLSEEDLTRKAESLFAEFTSTLDKSEALTCVRELDSPAFMPKVVEMGLQAVLNSVKDKEQDALIELLLFLVDKGAVNSDHALEALTTYTVQLEDLSLDVPKAPALLGQFYGAATHQGLLSLDVLPTLLEGDYSVGPKREFAAAALKHLQRKRGDAGLQAAASAAGLTLSSFLQADPEFDADQAPLEEWAKQHGLGMVPL